MNADERLAAECFGIADPPPDSHSYDDDGPSTNGAAPDDRGRRVSPVAAMLGTRTDLTTFDTSQAPPWTRGADRIMRPGLRSIWFGARGKGKSLAALILAVGVIEAGGRATIIDLENGPRRTAGRLAAILTDRPESTLTAVSERLDYRPAPRLAKLDSADAISEWAALFAGVDLLVIDSVARALAQLGLDENSTPDFARFMAAHVDPLAQQGTAVTMMDNTGWSEADRSRGASGKWDMCELVYKVTSTDFAIDKAGTITLGRERSRDGDEAKQLVTHVGEGTYTPLHVPPVSERVAAFTEAILSYLDEHPGATTEEVAKGIGMRKAECRSHLGTLEGAGTGNGTVVTRPSQHPDRNGRTRTRTGWYLASQSQLTAVPTPGTDTDPHTHGNHDGPGSPRLEGGDRTGMPDMRPSKHTEGPESEQW